MAKLPQLPQHVANLPKSGFDMSQSFGFTSSTGMLLPVYQDFLNPGEKVKFSGNLFSRTQPIVTAAMVDVDVNLDWFFVPASMLYTLFPSLMWMTDDRISSFYGSKDITNVPLCDINFSLSTNQDGDRMVSIEDLNKTDVYFYGDSVAKGRLRLADHLGFNGYGVFNQLSDTDAIPIAYNASNPNVFPMFPLAYQAIYEKHYRLEEREAFDPKWFNYDYLTLVGSDAVATISEAHCPFTLRYRPRKNDYFMSNMTSPILSGMSLLGSGSTDGRKPSDILLKIDNWLQAGDGVNYGFNIFNKNVVSLGSSFPNVSNKASLGSYSDGFNLGSIQQAVSPDPNSSTGLLSSANIRSVFALEKLMRITGRADKNYDAQVLAHFGWKVPHDVKHEYSFLGSDVGILHIGEVVSDADTYDSASNSGTALGVVGGKGYISIKGRQRSFTAPCHGVLMCIYSAVPRQRYYGGFDKQNSITSRLSFYQPEFDKLGAQPIFAYESDVRYLDSSFSQVDNSTYLGWQKRYDQWKRKYDRVSIAFMNPTQGNSINQYSAWVLATKPFGNSIPVDGSRFSETPQSFVLDTYLSTPHDLDNIMVMDYSSAITAEMIASPWLMFATDPFLNDFRANVFKTSTMSKTGEPNLD